MGGSTGISLRSNLSPLDKYLEVGFKESYGNFTFDFLRITILFFTMAVSIYIPTNSVPEFPFLHVLIKSCSLFNFVFK